MEVRCSGCKKLFRVSDDKITGSGIKFSCSRCGETVKITKSDFEQYKASAQPLAAAERAPAVPIPAVSAPAEAGGDLSIPAFDFDMPETPPVVDADIPAPPVAAPAVQKPAPQEPAVKPAKEATSPAKAAPTITLGAAAAPKPESKAPDLRRPQEPLVQKPQAAPPKQEIQIPRILEPEPPISQPAKESSSPAVSPALAAGNAGAPEQPVQPASSGWGKKIAVTLIILACLGGAGYGVFFYFGDRFFSTDSSKQMTLPEGLEVKNIAGAIDPANQDLVITGVVENMTDKPKAAWYVLAEVYDAQGAVLIKGKLLNGNQLYTRRDYDIKMRRGENIIDLKQKLLQQPGVVIGPKAAVSFELRILEPPIGIASFNALLQPFNPIELSREIAEEQK